MWRELPARLAETSTSFSPRIGLVLVPAALAGLLAWLLWRGQEAVLLAAAAAALGALFVVVRGAAARGVP